MPVNPVETHYSRVDLGETILAALKAADKDTDRLTPDDLAPVDEFHGGQRPATIRLAELVGFAGTERVRNTALDLARMSQEVADLRDRVSRLEGMVAAGMALAREANPGRDRRRLAGPSDQAG